MNEELNILLVDDNPDDRALIMRELSREFPNSHFRQAGDASELSEALNDKNWSLVVTDYQLGWSNGIKILATIKDRWPDCPVVMFTGSGNEEIAAQAMKAGLDDYILKSHRQKARLPSAVHLALDRAKQREALREAERRYQTLFDEMPVGIFRAAELGRIVEANPALIEMLGFPDRQSLAESSILNLFASPQERNELLLCLKRAGLARNFEAQFCRVDGTIIWAEVNARATRITHDQSIHYEGTMEDITARKEAEKDLRNSEARKSAILNSALEAILSVNHQGRITEFNPAAEKVFGRRRSEALGRNLGDVIISPGLRAELRRALDDARAAGEAAMPGKRSETTALRADGKEIPIELTMTRIVSDGPPSFTVFIRDITERKRAEKQLRDSREQLRALAGYLQSVREEERTRIAREVHDELGQALTGLKMDLARLHKNLAPGLTLEASHEFGEQMRELPARVDEIIGEVRKIATELRPSVLDDLGLEAAIEWQVRQFEKRTGIKCKFTSSLKMADLDPDRATAVFRIFQETLTNIVRHAGATTVKIDLKQHKDKLVLEVQDNGRGMTGEDLAGSKSLGLLGMRERATMLDGEVNIIGQQGKGTTVGVHIPLHRKRHRVKK